jgi:hypothetical protein
MRLRAALVSLVVSSITVHTALAQVGDTAVQANWSCYLPVTGGATYYNDPFAGAGAPGDIRIAYAQFVFQKHGAKGVAICSQKNPQMYTMSMLQHELQNTIADAQQRGIKVVQTSWVYNAATAALPHYCVGGTNTHAGSADNVFMHTAVLGIPGGGQDALTTAWQAYLKQQRPGATWSSAECLPLDVDPPTQQLAINSFVNQWKGRGFQTLQVKFSWP